MTNKLSETDRLHELYIKATDGNSSKTEQAKNWELYWEAKKLESKLTNTSEK